MKILDFEGERGQQGDHGQDGMDGVDGTAGADGQPGRTGRDGYDGRAGEAGPRGRSLNWWQTLAIFFLVLLTMLVLSYRHELQTQRINESDYASCQAGVKIIEQFNAKNDALSRVEQSLVDDPTASEAGRRTAQARIKAYALAKIVPLPTCTMRR